MYIVQAVNLNLEHPRIIIRQLCPSHCTFQHCFGFDLLKWNEETNFAPESIPNLDFCPFNTGPILPRRGQTCLSWWFMKIYVYKKKYDDFYDITELYCTLLFFSVFSQLDINKSFELVFDTFIKFSRSLRPAKQQDPIDARRIWKLLKGVKCPFNGNTNIHPSFGLSPQIHLIYLHKYI